MELHADDHAQSGNSIAPGSVRLVLYPPTRRSDVVELLRALPRLHTDPLPDVERASSQATVVLAALKRDDGLWLFAIDGNRDLPDSNQGGGELFGTLALQCEGLFAWPRDATQLEQRLRRRSRAAAAQSPTDSDDSPLAVCRDVGLIGRSESFRRALRVVTRLARYDVPVLLEGETGTGKELFARAVHYLGARRSKPFVPVNCAALPDTLLESELFGHARGAFTDARTELRGLVAQAEGGTLFFDEVHCLSPKGQGTVLRFVQDLQYRPLGTERLLRADLRIVAATNRSLPLEVAEGHFREDLMYRLNIASVHLPALRERREDIPLLIENAVERTCARFRIERRQFDSASLAWLCVHDWPGNVRELENVVCREILLSDGPMIRLDPTRDVDVADLTAACDGNLSFNEARAQVLAQFEARYLRAMLAVTHGNVTQAARQAGKERRVFGRLMKKHGIDRTEFA